MELKHTQGPWAITEHSWSSTGIYAQELQIALISIYDEATEENQDALEARTEANARLIAAAPDLLDALKQCAGVLSGEAMSKGALVQALTAARSAMEKATGAAP